MIQTAGVTLSLAAQAVADGTTYGPSGVEGTAEKDPGWVASQREAADARMLAGLEEQAEAFIAASSQAAGPPTPGPQHLQRPNLQ